MSTLALYWRSYIALRELGEDLESIGATDSKEYENFVALRNGYELARNEFLASLGITRGAIDG